MYAPCMTLIWISHIAHPALWTLVPMNICVCTYSALILRWRESYAKRFFRSREYSEINISSNHIRRPSTDARRNLIRQPIPSFAYINLNQSIIYHHNSITSVLGRTQTVTQYLIQNKLSQSLLHLSGDGPTISDGGHIDQGAIQASGPSPRLISWL